MHRQRGGQRHPQRQRGQALQHLDGLVDHAVRESPKIAGDSPEQDAEDDGQDDADDADGERDAPAVEDAGEHVPPERVRAE